MSARLSVRLLGLALMAWYGLGALALAAADDPAAPAAHAEAEHPAAGHGHDHIGHANAGPQLEDPSEVKSDLAIFTFVVFFLLLGILWKFAWGPISAGLDKREQSIAHHIAATHRAHEDAKQLLAEHEKRLAGTAGEVRAILEDARRDAEQTKQDILAEAKSGAQAERARAVQDIQIATDQALKSLAERSADLAVELAGKIVGSKLQAGDHARLIQEAVGRFPETKPSPN
jgi:F-type H+-transporting ATPase subunit b